VLNTLKLVREITTFGNAVCTDGLITVFNSGFAEGSTEGLLTPRARMETAPSIMESESHFVTNEFEDSDDDEDDDAMDDTPIDMKPASPHQSGALDSHPTSPAENIIDEDETEGEDQRNVRAKLSHPSSPRSYQPVNLSPHPPQVPSGSKMTVVVKDVAYSTYLALLYYVSRASSTSHTLHLTNFSRYTPILSYLRRYLLPSSQHGITLQRHLCPPYPQRLLNLKRM
jgi:hypothetical protein